MVIIVRMRVGVLYWQMFVFMGVVFGQVQPEIERHQ